MREVFFRVSSQGVEVIADFGRRHFGFERMLQLLRDLEQIAVLGIHLRDEYLVFRTPDEVAHTFMLTDFRTIVTDFTGVRPFAIVPVDE